MQLIQFAPAIVPLVAAIYSFMAVCSTVGFVHPKLRRPEAQNIRNAINSWWPPALVASAAALLGPWVGLGIFTIVGAWALSEYLRMLPE